MDRLVHNLSHEYYPSPVPDWTVASLFLHPAKNSRGPLHLLALGVRLVPSRCVRYVDQRPVMLLLTGPCQSMPVSHNVPAPMPREVELRIEHRSEPFHDFQTCNPQYPNTTSPLASSHFLPVVSCYATLWLSDFFSKRPASSASFLY